MKRAIVIAALMLAFTVRGQDAAPWWNAQAQEPDSVPVTADWWENRGLAAAWVMDEGSGTVAVDRITGTYNGVFSGAPAWGYRSNLTALVCDGTSDYITIPATLDVGTNGLAMGCWVFWSAATTVGLMGKHYAGSTARWGIWSEANSYFTAVFQMPGNDWQNTYLSVQSPYSASGRWVNVGYVVVRGGVNATLSLFFDGELLGSRTVADGGGDMTLARDFMLGSYDGSFNIDGAVRDAYLKFNGTTNDVKSIYNATKAAYGK